MDKKDHPEILNYQELVTPMANRGLKEIVEFLLEELPYVWCEAYEQMTHRQKNIWRFWSGAFEYIFDNYKELEAKGGIPYNITAESRLVAVLGRSAPGPRTRDDYRLRGWIGKTESHFGKQWDKGHYIAHSIGGAVDGNEANVFVQRRDLNRGWSEAGKRFRSMENYCFQNPGTFCFHRPIYQDSTARPSFVEFGLLMPKGSLWVECFDNR